MSTRSAAQGGFPQVPRLDTDVVKVCKQFYACWSGFRVPPRMTANPLILYHLATLAEATLSRLHKNQGFGAHSPADTKSWYYVFKPMFLVIGKTYPNFQGGMRFIFSLGPRELDYLREEFSASHRVPQGGTKVKKSDFRQIWSLRPRKSIPKSQKVGFSHLWTHHTIF